jgi:hypothetical protein
MDHLIYLFSAAVVITAALTGIAIHAPGALWPRVSAVALSALLMVTAYASQVELLGRPKSVTTEWVMRVAPEATVLAHAIDERRAIYLWLRFDGRPAPRAYVLPWSLATAKQLHSAAQQAKARGTGVRMRQPFARNREAVEPMFYAEPQPASPPKRSFPG